MRTSRVHGLINCQFSPRMYIEQGKNCMVGTV